eukprot:g11396.t1
MSAHHIRYEGVDNFPQQNQSSTWHYYYKTKNDNGKHLPYFYDVELTEDYEVIVHHGVPGEKLITNKTKSFATEAEAKQKVTSLLKLRKNFKGATFIKSNSSCRFGISSSSGKRERERERKDDDIDGVGSSSKPKKKPKVGAEEVLKMTRNDDDIDGVGSSSRTAKKTKFCAEEVLKMTRNDLDSNFPFVKTLQYDCDKIWADKDHQTVTKLCKKAGENVIGFTIIEGNNPNTGEKNFWCTGLSDGVTIIPYNLKLKLKMSLNGRPNHKCDDTEKCRVAAMYRDCELRGISFKKPNSA